MTKIVKNIIFGMIALSFIHDIMESFSIQCTKHSIHPFSSDLFFDLLIDFDIYFILMSGSVE